MSENGENSSSPGIFQLLEETEEKEEKREKEKFPPSDVKEFFEEGKISINQRTCEGLECKLCIDVCPTNALYWKAGEVGIIPELCIYCGACVLSCIVDDCIKIVRERPSGKVETFSKPRDFVVLQKGINAKKRFERVKDLFPEIENA